MDNNKSIEELTNDDGFIQWIKGNPTPSEWYLFKSEHLLPNEDLEFVRNFIEKASASGIVVSDNEMDSVWTKIDEATLSKNRIRRYWMLALLLLSVSIFSLVYFIQPRAESVADIAMETNDQWIEYTNTTNSNWPIDLSDGSQVILEPQAILKYPRLFSQKSRRVQLTGDAFFDISRDTLKPFYVYANEAVVRVLGTSFYVKAEKEDKDVQVIVKTGKVAVYRGKEIIEYQAKKIESLDPLLVTPNQIATLEKSSLSLGKRLVSRPTITQPLKEIKKTYFENSSISEIANALEKAYGIEIILDKSITDDCRLTTTLTDQPLFEKLKIICDPLGLKYLEKDVKIYIVGNCNN